MTTTVMLQTALARASGAVLLRGGGVSPPPNIPAPLGAPHTRGGGGGGPPPPPPPPPPLTIGHQHSLGKLVRSRLGARVLDRLVAPVPSGVYSARPDDIDVDLAAPGLNAALTRTGSLTGAVAELRARRSGPKPADAPASGVPVGYRAAQEPDPRRP